MFIRLAVRLERLQSMTCNGKKLSKAGPAIIWKADPELTEFLSLRHRSANLSKRATY